ncbi:MAG: lipopolysaccharide biosynthesis protein, partial [Pseudomonadota bacterium]
VLARLLKPEDFGLVAMVTAFSILFQNFGMRGFTEATVQSEYVDHRTVSTLFWIHIGISTLLGMGFIAFSPVLAWLYSEPRIIWISVAISANFLFFALATQPMALLSRNMQFWRVAGMEIGANILSVIVAIVFAVSGAQYWSLVARRVSLPLGWVILGFILCRWLPGLPARGTGVWKMVKFGINTYGNFMVNYGTRNLDKVLIGWKHGSASLGFYDRAYYLFVMPVNQLSYPLTNVAVSALSKLHDDIERFRSYYLKSISMLALVGMPLSAVLTIIGRDFILLLLGPQWDKAGEIFSYFGPGIGIMLVYGTHGWLHLSLGRADRWFRWGIIELIVTIGFFMAGLPFGAAGVAVAYVLSIFFLSGPGLWYAGLPINLTISSLVAAVWKFFAAAVAAGVVSWHVLYTYAPTARAFADLNIIFRLALATTLCSVLYLILVVLVHGGLGPIRQFVYLVREMIPGLPSPASAVRADEPVEGGPGEERM